jgi:hypothetical protein
MENKAGNLRKGKLKTLWASVFALAILWTSCAVEQDFFGASNILTTFKLTTPAAMDGKITIAEAYLKLNRIEVSGSLSGKNITSLTHPIPADEPPYNLTQADSSQVDFSVSSRAYDELDLHLFPFTDTYQLLYLGEPVENPPPIEEPEEEQGASDDENEDEEQGADEDNAGGEDGGNNQGGHNGEDTGDNDNSGDDEENDDGDDNDGDSEDESGDKDDDDDDSKDDKKNKGDKGKDKDNKDKNKGKGDHKHDDDDDDRDDDGDDDDDGDRDNDDDDDGDDRKSRNGSNSAVDLDHFFQNARPGLVVFGIYENNGKVINVILVVTDLEKLTIRGKQDDNFSITLAENNTAQLSFDPAYWFQSLTAQDIEGGTIQVYQQQKVLFIHPDHNTGLYQALVSRLEGSADLQISNPGTESF